MSWFQHCFSTTAHWPGCVVPGVRDPFDRQFLELALAGNAEVLVTGDVDLLASADRFAVPILSSKKFGRFLEHKESVDR